MSKKIEQAVLESLRQAVAIHQGKAKPSREFRLPLTARNVPAVPAPSYSASDIAALRKELQWSQAVLANILNVSLPTVQAWEQAKRTPDGAAARLLQIVERDPSAVTRIATGARKGVRRSA